jgi:hypothetical protein
MCKVGSHDSQRLLIRYNAVASCFGGYVPDGWYLSGEPSHAATTQDAAAGTRSAAKRRPAGKLSVSTTETAAISNARPNLNIGIDLWSNSPVKAETSGQIEINAAAPSHDVPLSQMVSMGNRLWQFA